MNLRFAFTADIQRHYEQDCGHFFDRDAKRFFRSRILKRVYQGNGGVFFVTSERRPDDCRRYSVRQYFPDTFQIRTVDKFNSLSRSMAKRIALRHAMETL